MERWWNAVVEIMVPFDTEEEARNAFRDDETIEAVFAIFGPPAVMSFRVEEAVEGVWPY
jgi:hypothetical protein